METDDLPPLTEALVQDLIYAWCSRAKHEITVPNCGTAWGYDSDVASVTRSRLGHEFEVKVSRADWLAELRQIRGDTSCAKRSRARNLAMAGEIAKAVKAAHAEGRSHAVMDGRYHAHPPPSYFWMVTTPGIIKLEELPDYAGLMEVEPYRQGWVKAHGYMLREARPAPRLHRVKMLDNQLMAMARGVTLRYWQQRRKAA